MLGVKRVRDDAETSKGGELVQVAVVDELAQRWLQTFTPLDPGAVAKEVPMRERPAVSFAPAADA